MQCSICNREFEVATAVSGDDTAICPDCLPLGPTIRLPDAPFKTIALDNAEPTEERVVGRLRWRFSGDGNSNLSWPISAAAHPAGGIVVLDEPENYRLLLFDSAGVYQRTIVEIELGVEENEIDDPQGVCVDSDGLFYIPDAANDRISVWSPEGKHVRNFGQPGSAKGDFGRPSDVDVDSDLFIYVTESFNRRVQKFSPEGIVSLLIDDKNVPEKWQNPVAVTTDRQNQIYIADEDSNLVRIFSSRGELLQRWPEEIDGSITFEGPSDIRIDKNGTVYISDRRNLRIRRFSQSGEVTGTIDLSCGRAEVYAGGDIAIVGGCAIVPDRANNAIVCLEFEAEQVQDTAS